MRRKILTGLVILAATCIFISLFSLACNPGEQTQGNETKNNSLAATGAYIGTEPIYMTIGAVTQGDIDGPCMLPGREGSMLVYGFKHELNVPYDSRSGLPTAKRNHSPLTVTKMFDEATPRLYKALTSGERFTYIVFEFYRLAINGTDEHYFTIELEDAVLVSMKPIVPAQLDGEDAVSAPGYGHMEELTFTYKKIIWRYELENIQTEDIWQPPKSG